MCFTEVPEWKNHNACWKNVPGPIVMLDIETERRKSLIYGIGDNNAFIGTKNIMKNAELFASAFSGNRFLADFQQMRFMETAFQIELG